MWKAAPVETWPAARDHEFQDEQLGTKEKFWIEGTDGGTRWLFKYARTDNRDGTTSGEDWAECLVHVLSRLIGIPTAHVRTATYRGDRGVISMNLAPSPWRLDHGDELLAAVYPDYDPDTIRDWQDPDTRLFVKVGSLDENHDGIFTFRYLAEARAHHGFAPLAQFPDLGREYETGSLPEFFANRVMSRRRENYDEYLGWLGLDDPAEPMEVLVRTGGARATDTFHIVDDLCVAHDGTTISRFFASGVRHIPGATGVLGELAPGQELAIRDDSGNPQNPRALLIDVRHDCPVGYIPNWLVDDVHGLRTTASVLRVFAERINPAAPAHLRLLCRLEAAAASE